MPLTQLDPKAALVLIDLQKGIVGMMTGDSASAIITHASELTRAFRQRGLPVVLVNVAGRPQGRTDANWPNTPFPPDFAELAPELDPQPDDLRVTKRSPGAFLTTSLHETLQALGVTQIFLGGISTSVGVEATGRSAFDLGYNVVFIPDAMTDRDPEAHRWSVEKVFPRLGETVTTDELLTQLRS